MSTSLVSYADLQQMPDDGRQYELYDGEVRVVPSPPNRHQFVLLNLVAVLMEYEQRHGGRCRPPAGWPGERAGACCLRRRMSYSLSTTWSSQISSTSGRSGATWYGWTRRLTRHPM